MAKLKMMTLALVAPRDRKDEILDYLQQKGVVEPEIPADTDGMTFSQYAREQSETQEALAAVADALEALDRFAPEKKPLTAMLEPRKTLTAEAYAEKAAKLPQTLSLCRRLTELEEEAEDCKAEIVRQTTLRARMQPWQKADIPILSGHTAGTAYLLGDFRQQYTREELLSALAAALPETDCVEIEVISSDADDTCAAVFCMRSEADRVEDALRAMGFSRAPECADQTPADYIAARDREIADNERRIREIHDEILSFAKRREELEFAADALSIHTDKLAACEKIPETQRIFYLEGYLPARAAKRVQSHLESACGAAVEIAEPPPDADVPVLLSNGFFSAPLQNITGMYSLPGAADIDPTGPMTFFYYLFFGMMLSDAGYGVIIALATGLVWLLKGKTLERRMKNNVKMYFFCGLSTVFWGAMYGSWFGDAPAVIAREFFGKPAGFNPMPPIWTDAVTDTMNVLIMCFILGLAHLFWGVLMKGWTDIKNGHPLDAVFDTIPTFLTVVGIAPIFFGLFWQGGEPPKGYSKLGTALFHVFGAVHSALEGVYVYILLAGIALVILTAGRSSKNIAGKLGGGLYGVYNLFSGYLGDVLSYARLLALGMATGVIGQVMNMLGTLPKNPVIKPVAFLLVFCAGHAANLAINIIGAYVHTNRLQYVEFFSKFYEGGGRAFVPFEANTKYYRFKEEL